MSSEAKIEQFKALAEGDPRNELAQFSLARAYLEAGRAAEAAETFDRVIALEPDYSAAYQLRAEAELQLGRRDDAIATLRRGVDVAAGRGEMRPHRAMCEKLAELGADAPIRAGAAAGSAPASGPTAGSGCTRCGRQGGRLPKPPFKGALGERIHREVCDACWQEWIRMGTMVINERGLALANPQDQRVYDEHMVEFLRLR